MIASDIPSLRQLRAFEATACLGSVSSAAREVNLSQPALPQSLHALEARLRIRLFERRRTRSTPENGASERVARGQTAGATSRSMISGFGDLHAAA